MTSFADTLRTERLTLRRPVAADLPAYRAYCASDRSGFAGGPFSPEKAFEKLAAMIGHWDLRGYGRYAMDLDGTGIGHVGVSEITDGAPEMTWTLWDGAAEGRGFATEAARAVARHVFDVQGWDSLRIHIVPENTGSVRVAERLGAQRSTEPAPEYYSEALVFDLRAADLVRQVPA